MPTIVNHPELGEIEFPDGISEEEMLKAIEAHSNQGFETPMPGDDDISQGLPAGANASTLPAPPTVPIPPVGTSGYTPEQLRLYGSPEQQSAIRFQQVWGNVPLSNEPLPETIAKNLHLTPTDVQDAWDILAHGESLDAPSRQPTKAAQVVAGAGNVINKASASMASPEGVALMMSGAGPVPEIGKAIQLAYAGKMAADIPRAATEAGAVFGNPKSTLQEKVEAGGDLALNIAMTGGLIRHGTKAGPKLSGPEQLRYLDRSIENLKASEPGQMVPKEIADRIDLRVQKLEARKAAVQQQIEEAETNLKAEAEKRGLETVLTPIDPHTDAPWQGGTYSRIGPDGKMHVDPNTFHDILKDLSPEKQKQFIESLPDEEFLHSRVSNADALEYFNNLTTAEKAIVRRRYAGSEGDQFSDTQLGHEAIRGALQQMSRVTPREVAEARGMGLSPKMLYGLEKTLLRLRERYSTKASTTQRDLLTRIQKNVESGLNKEERAAIDTSEAAPELAPTSENVPFATRRTPAVQGVEDMLKESNVKDLTARAFELGRKVKTKEEVKDLIRLGIKAKDDMDAFFAQGKALPAEKKEAWFTSPDFSDVPMRPQIVTEALEKATGFDLGKKKPGETFPVPMTKAELDALTSEVRKELDASKNATPAEVHGNVQPQPGEGAGQVPAQSGGPGVQLREEPAAAGPGQANPEEVLRLGTQVAREIKETAAAFRKKDEPLPPFPKYPELPKGVPPEQRKAAFDAWHKKIDEHRDAVAKWEAEWPEKEPIITKADNGVIRAITRDPKGGWRVTSFSKFGNEGKYAPWGHREYPTRAEAIRQEAPRDPLIHAEEMPDVLTEAEIKAMRDNPAAKRREKGQQSDELPLTPGSKDAPRNTAELGLPQITKEPVTAAKIADLTKEHLSVAKPSFANFLDDVKKRFGDVQPGQVREAWEDATWQRLMDAPGSELEGLVKRLGLTETLGDSPIPDIREKTQPRTTSTPMFPKPAMTVMETPARRANAIARIGEKLIGQALRKSADWKRKGVKPEDIGWWRVKEGQLPAFREVTPEELNSPDLGSALTQGSAESRGGPKTLPGKAAPETVTKRLVALQDRATGRVDLVSVYKTGRGAVYAADPTKTGERIHTPLQELLAKKTIAGQSRFVPRYSVLLDEPVQGFRQSFRNEAEFQERFGAEAADEAKRRAEVGEEPLAEGMEKPPERGLLFRGEEAKPDDLRAMSDLLMGEGELTQEGMQENLEALFAENRPKNPATGEPVPLTIRQLKGLDALVWARDRLQEISQEKGRPVSSEVALSNLIEYIHENAYLGRSRLAAKLGYELRIPPKPVPGRTQGKAAPKGSSAGSTPAAFRRPTKAELEWGVTKIGWGAQQALRAIGRQMGATNVRGPITRAIVRWRDAADNIASNAGRQAERGVEVNLENNSALERAALLTYRQTNKGTPALLDAAQAAVEARLPQFEAERNSKAVEQGRLMLNSIEFLRDPANAARVDRANEYFSQAVGTQFGLENSAGIAFTSRENYTPQVYDASGFSDDALLFPSRILGHRFTQAQNFPSYFDAYQAGYYPMKFDGAAVLGNRIRRGQKRVQYRLWLDRLKATMDPRTGEAIASETIPYDVTLANGTVETRYRPPSEEYELFSIAPGQRPIAVRKGYKDLLDVLTMQSPLSKSAPFRAALNLSAVLKHGVILIGDTFHPSRIGQYGASILGLEPKIWKIGNKGASALDYADAEMDRAVQKGFISQEEVDWARGTETVRLGPSSVDLSRRQILEFGQREGLNIGRVTDSLYRHFIDEIPGLSQFNRWTFDKVTRGLMAERFVSEFIRQNKKFPNMDARTLMGNIVRDLNFRFGSIGRQGLFRNPVMRDITQLAFLAPQWIEGLAQSEARVYARLLTAPIRTAFEAATGAEKRPVFGTLGRSMARGLAAYVVLTQAMNFITRGHGTWDNEEEGHKLDAWIPDVTGKTPGYFISPLSVFAEVTHDMVKYLGSANKSVDAVAKIVGNKLGPWGRVFTTLAFRENERGEKLTTSASVAKEAASKLFPAPISLSKPLRAAAHAVAPESVAPNRPGEMQRQLTASAGFKLDPAHTEIQRIYDRANDWLRKTKQKREEDVYSPTENAFLPQLRRAIRDGDNGGAMQLIEKLRYGTGDFSGRTDEQIAKAMAKYAKAPFTGTLEKEQAFYADLKPAEQKVYDAAMEAKAKEFEKFIELFEKRPERKE